MHKKDRPVIYYNPVTGDYKIPMRTDVPMPSRYQMQGYERVEFNSYLEHAAWCRKRGLVNHMAEGIKVEDDALGKNRWGY